MKINWKLRLKNKATLIAIASAAISFGYQIAGIVGIAPAVSQDQTMQMVALVLNVLTALGIIVDPTTSGVSDSDRAMNYDEPN